MSTFLPATCTGCKTSITRYEDIGYVDSKEILCGSCFGFGTPKEKAAPTPFVQGVRYIPHYYKPNSKGRLGDVDVIDIIQAYSLSWEQGTALKYLIRAGRKEGNSFEKDITKALEVLQRLLMKIKSLDIP